MLPVSDDRFPHADGSRTARIALVGLPGSGKTTAGRLLARELGWDFLDCDVLFEDEAGACIADWVPLHGWAEFREREIRILAAALAREPVVIATGGGVIEEERNRSALNSAVVIWLRASTVVLASRLREQVGRPLLGKSPGENLERIARRREALYAAVADFQVDAEHSPPEVLRRILPELCRLRIVS